VANLDSARKEIQDRIRELEKELSSLNSALTHLNGGAGNSTSGARSGTRRRTGGRRKSSGRRAPRGQRESQFLALVEKNPGIKGSAIASEIGISPNQVYGLAHRLTQAGKVRKRRGGGYALKT
jgi:predicted DNA-binding transcriptional regulator